MFVIISNKAIKLTINVFLRKFLLDKYVDQKYVHEKVASIIIFTIQLILKSAKKLVLMYS